MSIFRSKPKHSGPRDWTVGSITRQSSLAVEAPDVQAFAVRAINTASRGGRADVTKVLEGIDRVLAFQMDAYAQTLQGLNPSDLQEMRNKLYTRPDFQFQMFFDGLTYFGPKGVAISNGLAEQLAKFEPGLVEAIGEGSFDKD